MLIWNKNTTMNLISKVRGDHRQHGSNVHVKETPVTSFVVILWTSVLHHWNMLCGTHLNDRCRSGFIFSWTSHAWQVLSHCPRSNPVVFGWHNMVSASVQSAFLVYSVCGLTGGLPSQYHWEEMGWQMF